MIRNSILRCAAALVPFIAAGAVEAQLPAAQTILTKYGAVVNGNAFVNAKSVTTKGTMSMPAAGLNAQFQMTQLAPNQMQMVTTIPGMGEVQVGFDGTTGWAMDPMQGPRVLSGAELDQMRDEADRRANVRDPALFASVTTVADTTMNSERCYLVKLNWKSGRESYDCYSALTGLLIASKSVQKTAMGEIPVVTTLSDYKKFGDVMVPTRTVQQLMGQEQILTVTSVEFGDGTGVVIAPPDAVKALIKKQ
jgi:hypothetical protein